MDGIRKDPCYPLLLKGKKRYAGQKYEPGLKPKMDVKGLNVSGVILHRSCPDAKGMFIRLLTQKDMQSCVDYARQRVMDLMTGQVELDELQLSKQLTRKPEAYKNPASHVDWRCVWFAALNIPAPKTGDRIDYFIRTGFEKVCDRAVTREDIEGRAIIDSDWYLDNQLKQPLPSLPNDHEQSEIFSNARIYVDMYVKHLYFKKRPITRIVSLQNPSR